MFLTHAGMVFSFGENNYGQLGQNNTTSLEEPTLITSLLNYRVVNIFVGLNHNIAIASVRDVTANKSSTKSSSNIIVEEKKDQMLFAWGNNNFGQLGIGIDQSGETFTPTPKAVEDFYEQKFTTIGVGKSHTIVLLENGKVFGAGDNSNGQITPNQMENDKYNTYARIKLGKGGKDVFSDVKCGMDSTLFIQQEELSEGKNHIYFFGKITPECKILKTALTNTKYSVSDLDFYLTDDSCYIFYDSSEIDQNIDKKFTFEEVNQQVMQISTSTQSLNNKVGKINKRDLKINTNVEHEEQVFNTYNNQYENEERLYQEYDISKDFFSDNASTNEIFDNSVSFEQSIEELRSYISLVGISLAGDSGSTAVSFRPKNLPKKTPQEEEYHRKLVEDNRKRYMKFLRDKHEEDKRQKEKIDKKKEQVKKLQIYWENEILPNWFKKRKDMNSLRKYFYEGIPNNYRGRVWLMCIGNNFSITPEYYEIEVKKAVDLLVQCNREGETADIDNSNETDNKPSQKYNIKKIDKFRSIKHIELDIERTFSYLNIFKGVSPMGEDLREILKAFVASRPDIGYVQGLSYIGGMLLLHMDRYQAFVGMLNMVLNHNIIPFYRFDENQIRKRLQIFKQVFYFNLPELCDHFESLDILPESYLIEWFMTLFAKNLNVDIVARIWDVYMIEGVKAIFQAAIVILSHFEKKFLNSEFEDILKQLKNLNNINFDEDQLVMIMKEVKFPDWVNQEIQKLNDEYIPIYY